MNARLEAAIEACASGALPPNVALMQMIMAAEDETEVARALHRARASVKGNGPLSEIERLNHAHPHAFALVKRVANSAQRAGEGTPDDGLRFWTELYDRLARESPEAAVALYTLGSPELLARATEEVVDKLCEWQLIDSTQRILEVGCGQGRFLRALSQHVASITGLDVSAGMLVRAREVCAGVSNVILMQGSGRDLAPLADKSFELVLAVDAFPFIVDAGLERATTAEAARVLVAGGRIAVFNFSYRGDPARDVADVQALFAENGFAIERCGTRDFALWDAAAFIGRKTADSS